MRARFVNDTATVNVNPAEVQGTVGVKSGSVTGKVGVKTTVVITEHEELSGRSKENQHPISAITGLQQALDRLDTFVFEQAQASDIWEIQHNLGRYPSVEIVDTAGNKFFPAVKWVDENNIIVTMNGATKGKAYLN